MTGTIDIERALKEAGKANVFFFFLIIIIIFLTFLKTEVVLCVFLCFF